MTSRLRFTISTAKGAGAILVRHLPRVKVRQTIDARDVITTGDLLAEKYILSRISKKFPSHSIYSEEKGLIDNKSDYLWIIDPLDGSKYYIKGIKNFTVSVSLWHKEKPLLGAICNPNTKDYYYAEKGTGAYHNGKRLKVSNTTKLSKSIISLATNNIERLAPAGMSSTLRSFNKLLTKSYRLRNFGLGTLSLCYLAQGYFEAHIDITGEEEVHDNGAGIIIAQEAGAKVTDMAGKPLNMNTNSLVVSNGKIHQVLLKLLQK